jgi:hypothetical protein
VVTTTVAATATIILSTTVVTATTTVRTITSIIPPPAIRVFAPIHPIPATGPISTTGPTVILIAKQSIAPFTSRNLVANGFRCQTSLLKIFSMPFYITRQIRQLGWTKALPHTLRHNRCAVFRGDAGFLNHRQTFRTDSQHVRTHSLPLVLTATRQITDLICRRAAAKRFGQRLHGSLTIPLPLIDHPLRHRFLQHLSGRLEVPHHLFQHRIDSPRLHTLG